jgi:basic membrane protein A
LLPKHEAVKLASNMRKSRVSLTSIPLKRVNPGGALKKSLKLIAVAASLTLITGVAVAPSAQAAKIKLCLALDTGGVDDRSFNQGAWEGAKSSKVANAEYLAAATPADFAPNIKAFVDKKCDLIIGVGFAISGAIVKSALANPNISYAVVDDAGADCDANFNCKPVKNVKGLTFQTDEAAFMAGYLSAGMTKTGKVATYGGAPYPTVTIFMDGYVRGVDYYNKVKNKKVSVLGWDIKTKTGSFVGNFIDQNAALTLSKGFEQQGADIILPVGGNLGAPYAAANEKTKKALTIWVDSDGYNLLPAGKSTLLTTVVKEIGASIKSVAKDVADKKFNGSLYVGTLKNKGVSIAPYHDLSSRVPGQLKLEIRKIREQIIAGTLKVNG